MVWTKKQISILAIVAASSFFGTFLFSSVNIALPAIEREFGPNAITLSWVMTSFLLSTAMFLLPVGRWGDLSGIRRLYKFGMVLFTLASFLSGCATSIYWLIVMRFFQGIGAAFSGTTGSAILVSSFLPQYRGRVLGISIASVYLGLTFGPFAGGLLTQYLGWRSIFFLASGFCALVTMIGFLFLEKDEIPQTKDVKLDWKGTLFYMVGLLALTYGSARIPQLFGVGLMSFGVLFLLIFWRLENHSEHPVLETRLFTENRLFAFSNLAALINYSATFSIVFLLSLYLQKVKGLPPREAGSILVAQPFMMALFSPVIGRLSDKMQPRYLATIGMVMCSIGLTAFAFLSESTPISFIVLLLFWVGIGFALFSSPNMNTIMSSVQKNQIGLAAGFASSMRVVGQITSMSIATLFFAILFNQQAAETVANSLFLHALKLGFLTFATISLAGIYFSLNRGRMNLQHERKEVA